MADGEVVRMGTRQVVITSVIDVARLAALFTLYLLAARRDPTGDQARFVLWLFAGGAVLLFTFMAIGYRYDEVRIDAQGITVVRAFHRTRLLTWTEITRIDTREEARGRYVCVHGVGRPLRLPVPVQRMVSPNPNFDADTARILARWDGPAPGRTHPFPAPPA